MLARLVPLVLQISIALIVFSVGLLAKPGDLTSLWRRPSLLLRSILAMNVVAPLVAAALAGLFHLKPAVEVALVLLAVSPVPPILPGKQGKAGGDMSYAVGLLATSALLAIVVAPASVVLLGRLFGHDLAVPVMDIARVVAMSVLGPLIAGTVVARLAPSLAQRIASPLSKVGTLLLLLGLVPLLLGAWRAIAAQVGDFTLVAIAVFVLVSLIVGHVLGGPAPEDRTVLALSSASRHPGVALAIAGAIASPELKPAVSGAVLLSVLVGAVVTAPYTKWRRRTHAAPATASAK